MREEFTGTLDCRRGLYMKGRENWDTRPAPMDIHTHNEFMRRCDAQHDIVQAGGRLRHRLPDLDNRVESAKLRLANQQARDKQVSQEK